MGHPKIFVSPFLDLHLPRVIGRGYYGMSVWICSYAWIWKQAWEWDIWKLSATSWQRALLVYLGSYGTTVFRRRHRKRGRRRSSADVVRSRNVRPGRRGAGRKSRGRQILAPDQSIHREIFQAGRRPRTTAERRHCYRCQGYRRKFLVSTVRIWFVFGVILTRQ